MAKGSKYAGRTGRILAIALALMFMVPVGVMFAESAEAQSLTQPQGNHNEKLVNTNFYFHRTLVVVPPATGPGTPPSVTPPEAYFNYTMDLYEPTSTVPATETQDAIASYPTIGFLYNEPLKEDLTVNYAYVSFYASITAYGAALWLIQYVDYEITISEIKPDNTVVAFAQTTIGTDPFLYTPAETYNIVGEIALKDGKTSYTIGKGSRIGIQIKCLVLDIQVTYYFDSVGGVGGEGNYPAYMMLRSNAVQTYVDTYDVNRIKKTVFDINTDTRGRTVNVGYYVVNAFGVYDIVGDYPISIKGPDGNILNLDPLGLSTTQFTNMKRTRISDSTILFELKDYPLKNGLTQSFWQYPSGAKEGIYAAYITGNTVQNVISDSVQFTVGAFDFKLEMSPGDSALHYVLPDEPTVFTFNLNNSGASTDEYFISAAFTPGSTQWPMDGPTVDHTTLAPKQSQEFKLTLWAPQGAVNGSKTTVRITVLSPRTSSTKTVDVTAEVRTIPVWGVDVSCGYPLKNIRPGQTAIFPVSVRNLGYGRDNFPLSAVKWSENATLNNPEYLNKWNIDISPPTIDDLYASSIQTIFVTVTAPADAIPGTNVSINITATSYKNPTMRDNVTLKCKVYTVYDFSFLDVVGTKSHTLSYVFVPIATAAGTGAPVGSAIHTKNNYFRVIIKNEGDGGDTYRLWVTGSGNYWEISVTPTQITIPAGGFGEVKVKTKFTDVTNAAASIKTVLHVQSLTDSTVAHYLFDLVSTRKQPRIAGVDLEWIETRGNLVELGKDNMSIQPGRSAIYRFRITNTGNAEDIFYLSTSTLPSGWTAALSAASVTLGTSNVDGPGLDAEVTLTVTAPADARLGTNVPIDIFASSKFDSSKSDRIRCITTISQRYELLTSVLPASQLIHPGDEAHYTIVVNNKGNGYDDYALSLNTSALPAGWTAELTKNSLSVPGLSSLTSILKVKAPASASAEAKGIVKVNVTSALHPDNKRNISTISTETTVKAFISGIELSADKYFSAVKSGDKTQYAITVKNVQPAGSANDTITVSLTPPPEGWKADLGYYANYFDGNDAGWTKGGDTTTGWSVKNGEYVFDGNQYSYSTVHANDASWKNYEVKGKVMKTSAGDEWGGVGIVFRYIDEDNYWRALQEENRFWIWGRVNGTWTGPSGAEILSYGKIPLNTWYWIKARAEGSSLKAKIWKDGDAEPAAWTVSGTDSRNPNGGVGFCTVGGARAKFDDIEASYIPTSFASGESKQLILSLKAPTNAIAGTSVATIVRAVSANPAIFAQKAITTNVTGLVAISVSADELEKYVDPGSFTDYSIRVYNDGTDIDTIRLERSAPYPNWNVQFAGGQPDMSMALNIPAKSFRDVSMRVTAPSNAQPAFDMPTEITARSLTNTSIFSRVTVTTRVAFREVNISAVSTEKYLAPDEQTSYVITAWNNGSGREQVDVSLLGGMPAGWTASLDKPNAVLESGASVDFILTVKAPKDAPSQSSATVVVKAASHSLSSVFKTLPIVTRIYQYVTADVDDDNSPEFAVDRNNNITDGFESFKEIYEEGRHSRALYILDGDKDNKKDFILDTVNNTKPDTYWDPDNGTITKITKFVDEDNNTATPEAFFLDANNDGKPDYLYIPKNGTLMPVLVQDVNKDGKPDYLIDVNNDGIYDTYHDPAGKEGNYAPVYYDSKTGTYSAAPPVEKTPFGTLIGTLGAYWYLAVLLALVLILAIVVVNVRRR